MAGKLPQPPKIPDEHRAEIVILLAQFKRPSHICAIMKERHGYELSHQYVDRHDPTRGGRQCLGKRWKALYAEERERYTNDIRSIPIANQAYRLDILQQLQDQMRSGSKITNPVLVMRVIEQTAKEVGGAYTNKQVIVGTHGVVQVEQATADQMKAALKAARDEF